MHGLCSRVLTLWPAGFFPKNLPRPMVNVPCWAAKTPKSMCTPTRLKVRLILRPSSSLKSARMLPNVRQSLHSTEREKLSVADASIGTGPPSGM